MAAVRSQVESFLIALATALVILALTIPLFLNPLWVGFEQGRAEAAAWTGFTVDELRTTTDSILVDLVIGPPDFDVEVGGAPVLNDRERGHMRDVRTVFIGFYLVTLIAVALAGVVVFRRRRRGEPTGRSWRSIRSGALGLILGLVLLGVFAVVAFDSLFAVFHQVLFSGGSYTFDPASERLVQLFPFQFWQETAIAVGVAAVGIAAVVAFVADRRSRRT